MQDSRLVEFIICGSAVSSDVIRTNCAPDLHAVLKLADIVELLDSIIEFRLQPPSLLFEVQCVSRKQSPSTSFRHLTCSIFALSEMH